MTQKLKRSRSLHIPYKENGTALKVISKCNDLHVYGNFSADMQMVSLR